MIKEVELFLAGEIRHFEVGKNCERISEFFGDDGISGIRILTNGVVTKDITFVGVPYALYCK